MCRSHERHGKDSEGYQAKHQGMQADIPYVRACSCRFLSVLLQGDEELEQPTRNREDVTIGGRLQSRASRSERPKAFP